MRVAILFNQPILAPDHPDAAQEHGVLEAVDAIDRVLVGRGEDVHRLAVGGNAIRVVDLPRYLASSSPDVVVNLCEGVDGDSARESYLTGLLELAGVPYTGSGPDALALVHHKARTSWLLSGCGVSTAASVWVRRGSDVDREGIAKLVALGPVIVKPAAEDASLGIHQANVVTTVAAALDKVDELRTRFGDVLVERFIDGREFNLGVVALPLPVALAPAEILFQRDAGWAIVSYEAKWHEGSAADRATPAHCPAKVTPELGDALTGIALAAFAATGCRDYARVDVRVDRDGQPFVLEVNGNPDLTPTAGLARALAASGMSYDDFIVKLVEVAAARGPRRSRPPSAVSRRPSGLELRALREDDRKPLVDMTRATGVFRDDEVEVADELLGDALARGALSDYRVIVVDRDGLVCGFSCHGQVPMTDATYDLYWIVVSPELHGRGVGGFLLGAVEEDVRRAGGRWVIAETSSTPVYAATRRFYETHGYAPVGDVPDFYRLGDGRVTYGRRVDRAR